jgi:hypothetical protein
MLYSYNKSKKLSFHIKFIINTSNDSIETLNQILIYYIYLNHWRSRIEIQYFYFLFT